ncbi:hypothetical protein KACHI17_22660 [Sediminibacterium sp. KACHI17]|uniref:FtsX-like permease family protein n=1 Tax=Sediminibacterium sp. KACHI17 TaxID=1751071 RepID=A0AAT9GLB7_9BACT
MNDLNILLKKLIRTATGRTRYAMSIIGLSVALLLILAAVQIQVNYNELLQGKQNRDSVANFLVVNKILTDQNIGKAVLSEEEINDIKAQPFTEAIGVLQTSRFKASIQSSSDVFPFYTDIAFESVPDAFLDINPKEWNWNENSGYVPIIVPGMFLDIYNFQFSFSQGLPQLTREVVKMIFFNINVYGADGTTRVFKGKVVGFSDRVSSLLIPQSFMNHANQLYGKNIGSAPSRIIIRTKDPGHPELISYLKQKQLTTDQDKTRFSKYRQIVEMVVNITGVTGLLMFLFAMLIFTLFIQLTISSCKEEIKLLLTLGASPSQLRSFLIRQFFPSNIWIVLCSLLIISLVQYGFALFLQQQSAFISYFISPITMGISFFILLIIYILNRRNINTSIRNY